MAERNLFVITGFGGGVSVGVQSDTVDEMKALATALYGEAVGTVFLADAFGSILEEFEAAKATKAINAAVGPVTLPPVSSVGGVAQPPAAAAAPAVAQAAPPLVEYPGDCAHGRRVFVDKPARGKPWRRWECAVPWSKDVQGRCSAVNV